MNPLNPLVSPAWLAEHIEDPNLAILDATLPPPGVKPAVDARAHYLAQHIPGAVFFDIEELSDPATALPHMLPMPEEFSRSMSALGVGDRMTLVVYEQNGVFSSPRAWWMLRVFGAQDARILDGGLRGWMEAGLPTQSGPVSRTPGDFHARLRGGEVKDFGDIQRMIAAQAQILDARSAGRFSGAMPEPRPGIPSGHMPGAVNIPYLELVEGGHLKSASQMAEIFQAKGVDLAQPVTTTCGSGITAAVLALGLQIAGATRVSLYDGSWAEYAGRPEAAILKDS